MVKVRLLSEVRPAVQWRPGDRTGSVQLPPLLFILRACGEIIQNGKGDCATDVVKF
jgi:hypothetical protein